MNDEIAPRTLLQRNYLHNMDDLNTLNSLGLTLPSPAYLLGAIIFGIIGFAAYRYGKKTYNRNSKWIGIGLMLYPYAVSQTWLLYLVGVGLCAGLYFFLE